VRTSRTSKCWVANSFNICLNFKASNWAQFSSDLQNSNSFEKLRSSSIIFAKKNFFSSRAHATYKRCIYIYLLTTHLQDNLKSFCADSYWVRSELKSIRIEIEWFEFLTFGSGRFQTETWNRLIWIGFDSTHFETYVQSSRSFQERKKKILCNVSCDLASDIWK
jgi:hypothetical protein